MYDNKPWLKFYDGREENISIPDITYLDLLERTFEDYPERTAIQFFGTDLTFAELDECSARFANFLVAIGCVPGDVIGIDIPNVPQYIIALEGALRAGCMFSGVSPLLVPKEMSFQINDAGAKVLVIMDELFEDKFLKMQDDVPNLSHVVVTGATDFLPESMRPASAGPPSVVPGKTVHTFPDIMDNYEARCPQVAVKPDDTCIIQYTGGTTGMPKGTELTHRNVVSNISQFKSWFRWEKGEERWLSAFPFFHIGGLCVALSSHAIAITQILIPDPRNLKHLCGEITKNKPTMYSIVPTLLQMLLGEDDFKTLDFSGVKTVMSGAAPLTGELLNTSENLIGKGKLMEMYGLTETCPFIVINPPQRIKVGSVGVPIQNTMIKLVDLDSGATEVPFGEEGEIIVRGPQVMKGYLNKPEETDHALREFQGQRWLYTGDIGKMDNEGYIFIVDRAKDMLNVSGYKVFSKEVEETLYAHPAVEFCAIVGVPNPDRPGSDMVKAVIQLESSYQGRDPEEVEEDIIEYCRENMAPYKVPKIVEFIDAIPLTSVGKVDKKALR